MKNTIKLIMAMSLLMAGFASGTASAGCYAFPFGTAPGNRIKFEGNPSSCPDWNGFRWMEICVKPSGGSSYNLCASNVGYGSSGVYVQVLVPPGQHTYRARYTKSGGGYGVATYGSVTGAGSGSSSGGSGSGGCPPDICGN